MYYVGSIYSQELVRTSTGFPFILYTFTNAITDGVYTPEYPPEKFLLDIADQHPDIIAPPRLYCIAYAWNASYDGQPVKAMDVFGYEFDVDWKKCNPDIDIRTYRGLGNDIIVPDSSVLSCGTAQIINGIEEVYRRRTGDLEHYLRWRPELGELLLLRE